MKGPMVTQTLQDIITPPFYKGTPLPQLPLHWRGDRKDIEAFNPTFTNLQANDRELTTNEMAELKAMLASIYFPPNFFRTFSNTPPVTLALPGLYGAVPTNGGPRAPLPPGSPDAGIRRFNRTDCTVCHGFDQGTDIIINQLASALRSGTQGAFKASQLRSLGEKIGMDGLSTNGSRAGFGFTHDGRVDTLTRFFVDGFPAIATNDQAIADMTAFLLCFNGSDLSPNPGTPSQDVPAATGKQITLNSPVSPPLLTDMFNLALRPNSRVELVVRGRMNGHIRQWLLLPATQNFQSDRYGEIVATLGEVIQPAAPGNEFTATLVPGGMGVRLALDRDGDGYFDTTETELGYDPADPNSHPGPVVAISMEEGNVVLSWASTPGSHYAVEVSTNFPQLNAANNVWTALGPPFTADDPITTYTDTPPGDPSPRFYRVRQEP
jgi:hypothetical protein